MPLIMISGFPVSGKSKRAEQIREALHSKVEDQSWAPASRPKQEVHLISDDTLSISRDVYGTAKAEKDARAAFYSAIKRALSPHDIVIADGLNYIKGFRYQLFCEAKALSTASCVVHVGTPAEKCHELYHSITSSEGHASYTQADFENLISRYEEPNGMSRWDSPLFVVPFDDTDPPYDAIWNAIVGSTSSEGRAAKAIKPNLATVLKPAASSDFLHYLDRTTQDVIAQITAYQKDHADELGSAGSGGSVPITTSDAATVSGGEHEKLSVDLPPATHVSLPLLQRHRRQFINFNRTHYEPQTTRRIAERFVGYLNDQFQGT